VTDFLALAIAGAAIDGVVWGFAGFCVFRLLGGRRRWWVGILATVVVALLQQGLVFLPLVRLLDLRIGNEAVADLLGTDKLANLITFDPFSDVAVTAGGIALGFMVAGWFDERRSRWSRSGDVASSGRAG
jgi:hypothetical protein